MKYYLIAGEASGDLHASRLIAELGRRDPEASFRAVGGDLMAAAGATLVKHYRNLAYMGFVPVLLHLRTILGALSDVKRDIVAWGADVVILVDYPGFNMKIARFLHARTQIPAVYYIAPKVWAWREWRVKAIRRDVSLLLSILPFEVDFFERKHHCRINYVGNPTADEVGEFLAASAGKGSAARGRSVVDNQSVSARPVEDNNPAPARPVIALLCGSRTQEIRDNLPAMIAAAEPLAAGYRLVVAGAPSIAPEYYEPFLRGHRVEIVFGETYKLLSQASVALVTSGTATLETCLFGVPQVVCYETPLPQLIGWLRRRVLSVRYISLVNLIADAPVVPELVAETFTVDNIASRLRAILPGGPAREEMLRGYRVVREHLGSQNAPETAAGAILDFLKQSGFIGRDNHSKR